MRKKREIGCVFQPRLESDPRLPGGDCTLAGKSYHTTSEKRPISLSELNFQGRTNFSYLIGRKNNHFSVTKHYLIGRKCTYDFSALSYSLIGRKNTHFGLYQNSSLKDAPILVILLDAKAPIGA